MSTPSVVFLISAPYSGATLLSILMNQHPDISSDGEIFPYERGSRVVCSCGRDQIDCEYYSTIAGGMLKENGEEYDDSVFYYVPRYCKNYYLSRGLEGFWMNDIADKLRNLACALIPAFKALEGRFLNLHLELFSKSLALREATVYFDGSKSVRRAEFFAERKLTSKIIHLIRDGRAFCNSFLKNKRLPMDCVHVAEEVWKKSIKKVDVLRRRHPGVRILDVRYNDLCSAPKKELRRIWEFLGLNYDDAFLEYRKKDMHILGNRMRFNYSGVIKEDNTWEKSLNQIDVLLLNKLMEDELRRFGFIN